MPLVVDASGEAPGILTGPFFQHPSQMHPFYSNKNMPANMDMVIDETWHPKSVFFILTA